MMMKRFRQTPPASEEPLDLEVDVVGNVKWVEIILNHAWIEA
jgi:hypothetical protein